MINTGNLSSRKTHDLRIGLSRIVDLEVMKIATSSSQYNDTILIVIRDDARRKATTIGTDDERLWKSRRH